MLHHQVAEAWDVLQRLALVSDPEAVSKVIRNGFGRMPPVGRDWDENELNAITTYLEDNLGG